MANWRDLYQATRAGSIREKGVQLYQIHEIFTSIQFEGQHHGTRALFVRFFGCNLYGICEGCDTPQSIFESRSRDGLLKEINEEGRDCNMVVLTGGEPCLQPIHLLLYEIPHNLVGIETNGTRPAEAELCKEHGAWLTFSPKPIEDWQKRYKKMFSLADEIKIVLGMVPTPEEDLVKVCEAIDPPIPLFVQPKWDEKARKCNLLETLKFIQRHPKWKLSFQLHKLLGMK